MNANNIEGTVSVSQAAVFVNNVRDRVISGMKSILKDANNATAIQNILKQREGESLGDKAL